METAVELKNITVDYGAGPILSDLSLRVEPGEILALLGSSGCGKTTILKVISGLLRPRAGEVLFGGENFTDIAVEKREAVVMFQKPLLFPYLNVAGNVAFGLKMRNLPKKDIQRKVAEALEMVQLSGLEKRLPQQLSGGQEQRVALARAIVTEPRVLLLDEPLTALDANLREEMRYLLRDLQQRLRLTTIFVTHDQPEAVVIADKIAFMNAGKIEQIAAAREFFAAPKTPEAAAFFGWKIYNGEKQGKFIETEIGKIVLPFKLLERPDSTKISIAFHPDNIGLCTETNGNSPGIDAELLKTIDLGKYKKHLIRLRDNTVVNVELPEAFEGNNYQNGFIKIYLLPDSIIYFEI